MALVKTALHMKELTRKAVEHVDQINAKKIKSLSKMERVNSAPNILDDKAMVRNAAQTSAATDKSFSRMENAKRVILANQFQAAAKSASEGAATTDLFSRKMARARIAPPMSERTQPVNSVDLMRAMSEK